MKIVFFSLFPSLILPYFEDSILKRAIEKKIFEIEVVNFREFAKNRHKKVDTEIAGGGAGMILDNVALREALSEYKIRYPEAKTVFLTPVGKRYNQKDAIRFSKEKTLFLVCGRYEGFDERLIEDFADEVISIGDFILTGGELGALAVADSVLRNIKGVLGNIASLEEESFNDNLLEAPQFSKMGDIPQILKSGNHRKISEWKQKASLMKTKFHRPDLV
ncbi:tRNA (guanosine(37)-N1)-methyltransferase TrmD [Caminibacter sp.]